MSNPPWSSGWFLHPRHHRRPRRPNPKSPAAARRPNCRHRSTLPMVR
jgi:hypothetical protein